MAKPTNPVVYENIIKIMHSDLHFENGHVQPNLETCPVCGKYIMRCDRVSILKDGKHWHLHRTCRKNQHKIIVKENDKN